MNISIFRRRFTKWGWDGSLFINGNFFCGTLENCRSRLAQGTYKIALLLRTCRVAIKDKVELKNLNDP